jgi:hypothetical protein
MACTVLMHVRHNACAGHGRQAAVGGRSSHDDTLRVLARASALGLGGGLVVWCARRRRAWRAHRPGPLKRRGARVRVLAHRCRRAHGWRRAHVHRRARVRVRRRGRAHGSGAPRCGRALRRRDADSRERRRRRGRGRRCRASVTCTRRRWRGRSREEASGPVRVRVRSGHGRRRHGERRADGDRCRGNTASALLALAATAAAAGARTRTRCGSFGRGAGDRRALDVARLGANEIATGHGEERALLSGEVERRDADVGGVWRRRGGEEQHQVMASRRRREEVALPRPLQVGLVEL